LNSSRLKPRSARWLKYAPLLLLLAARLALGLAYSQVVPVWESDNEDGHFAYARYLAKHHTLVLRPDDPAAAQVFEKFQPPLYYDLIAPVIAGFDLGQTFAAPTRNPFIANGDAGINYALHPVTLSPAERSIESAIHAARVVSLLISTLSVIAVFLTARRLWPTEGSTAWAATALYAFWPEYLFVGSMVTNDGLITALSASALLLSVHLTLDGFRLRWVLLLSAVVGLALLTKLNGISLIALACAAVLFSLLAARGLSASRRSGRLWLGVLVSGLLVAAALWLLSSFKFVTAQVLRLSSLQDFVSHLGPGSRQGTLDLTSAALSYAFRTFLASYGWGNLETFEWMYWIWAVAVVVAVAGFIAAAWRRGRGKPNTAPNSDPPARAYALMLVFGLALLGLTLALAIAAQSIYLVPGRYLLPALPAVVFLLVGGWRSWLPAGRWRRRTWQLISVGLIIVGWLVPFRIIAPAYARPSSLSVATAKLNTTVAVFFDDSLELLAYSGPTEPIPGGALKVTLCWQAVAHLPADYTLLLEVVGADGQGYGRLRTYPGRGNYPTTQWALNTPFCEEYTVPVTAQIPAPALANLRLAWLHGLFGPPLAVRQSSGQLQGDPAYGIQFKVGGRPGYIPPIAQPVDYRFGAQIRLTGYAVTSAGSSVGVTLRWQVLQDVRSNYVVFVHLRDSPSHAFAQGDGLPRQGAYPTGLWRLGENLLDEHRIGLPALPATGSTPPLALYVGLYDLQTNIRLPAFDANNSELRNDEVILASGLVFP
jgi:4-amino-4-deoxy-L-arabinose transferase-like glycosyltransferase